MSRNTPMPLKRFSQRHYPVNWDEISISRRTFIAKSKCEWCGVLNHSIIKRSKFGLWRYASPNEINYLHGYAKAKSISLFKAISNWKFTRVVLTVAHLNHIPEDCNNSNLAALCQKCHLNYDNPTHNNLKKKFKRSPS